MKVEFESKPIVKPDPDDTSDVHNVTDGAYVTLWNEPTVTTGVPAGGRLEIGTSEHSIACPIGRTDCPEWCETVDGM